MEKIARIFFSMRMMAVGMTVFFLAIGWATLLESQYDIQTAKIMIYNALWFELLLAYLCINLIANIFNYRMYRREKIAMFMFHLSFIVMIIGAGATRFLGFEGMLMVRENQEVNYMYSADPYFWFTASEGEAKSDPYSRKSYMSERTNNYFKVEVENFPDRKSPIVIEYANFQKNLIDSLVINDSIQGTVLDIVTDGMSSNYLSEGEFLMVGDVAMSFNKEDAVAGIELFKQGRKILVKTMVPLRYLPMSEMQKARQSGMEVNDSLYKVIPMDTLVPFETTTLYQTEGQQFVFKQVIQNAKEMKLPSGRKDAGKDCLTLKITDGEQSKFVDLIGGFGQLADNQVFEFNGVSYQMQYGSMPVEIPFYIRCRDFQLDKYPGSDSPSSFASEITVIDKEKGVTKDRRIFMNNVMDYRGYRFFQSGYDPDEGGTRLSVSNDRVGTNISYLGYLMMGIGMLLSLIAPQSRFRVLARKLNKSSEKREGLLDEPAKKIGKHLSIFVGIVLMSSSVFGQEHDHEHTEGDGHNHTNEVSAETAEPPFRIMSEEHSEEMASLLVQNFQGRIVPMHTLCDQILRKVSHNNVYGEYNAVQTIMSMHMYQGHWARENVIYVSSKSNLREKLGMEGGLISYIDLTNEQTQEFILADEHAKAHQKIESKRNEFDKRLLKLGERYQVMSMIFRWDYLHLIPMQAHENNKWFIPFDRELVEGDSIAYGFGMRYFTALNEAPVEGKYGIANDYLSDLKKFQRDVAKNIVPSESKVAMEISYNKMNIFKNSFRSYGLIGLVLLIIAFLMIFKPAKEFREPSTKLGSALRILAWIRWKCTMIGYKLAKVLKIILLVLVVITFLYHGYGLYMRWSISGHAPWSNAYEAVVFIAWITVATGLIFSRKNVTILAGTAILAALMIFVTEMNLLDPEITQLQPVLKSYWLMIHVAVITGSYAPLGIVCILGLFNLLLYILRNKRNGEIVTMNINEITYVSEMVMTIGVFMLTIGTFLGGIWANESWGRYWGWDPKETWALVAILAYAVILHFRYIPALKDKFTFNVAGFWGYTTILFTFFGVNFYLVGLHSYAQGEGLGKIPEWIGWAILAFYILTEIAAVRRKIYETKSGIVPAKFFIKKAIILSGVFLFLAILAAPFGVLETKETFGYVGMFTIYIVLTNGVLFGYSYLRTKMTQE